MKLHFNWLFVACLVLISPIVSADNGLKTDWLNEEQSKTRHIVAAALTESELPSEKTQYLNQIDINIVGGRLSKRVKTIQYYSTFNETHADGTESIYWDKEVQEMTLFEAGVITKEGVYKRLDSNNIRVVESDTYNTFTDNKEVMLPFSGLEDQSFSVLEYEISYNLGALESAWAEIVYPVIFEPVKEFGFTVSTDQDFMISWQSNQDQVKCEEIASNLKCSATELAPYELDESVIWRDTLGQIMVAQRQSWDNVIESTLTAFDKSEYSSEAITQLAQDLFDDASPTKERIQAIHEFVARNIRYISMSELGHRITPHRVDSILTNRFGDCKDKSALLVGLLNAAGLDPFPVLIATERRDHELITVPSTRYFDHMIVCFSVDQEDYCLDATDTSTHWKNIPAWIHGRVSLPLKQGSNPLPLQQPEHLWRLDITTDVTFSKNGGIKEKQKRDYFGEYAGGLRSQLAGIEEDKLAEWAVEQYQSKVPNSTEPEFEFVGLSTMEDSLNIVSTASYDPFLDITDNLNYVDEDSWIRAELSDSKTTTKHYDTTIVGLKGTSFINYELNGLWSLTRSPASLDIKNEFGSLSRNVSSQDGNLNITTTLKIKNQILAQNKITHYNEFIDLLIRESKIYFQGQKR